jgi:hypothetical protein
MGLLAGVKAGRFIDGLSTLAGASLPNIPTTTPAPMKIARLLCLGLFLVLAPRVAQAQIEGVEMPPDDGRLRIICFGAHPDDCELQAGGTAALWAEKGHHVLFVSVTNGDIGHWRKPAGHWRAVAWKKFRKPTSFSASKGRVGQSRW